MRECLIETVLKIGNVLPYVEGRTPCGTISRFGPLNSLPLKFMKIWSIFHCSPPLSPLGNQSAIRTTAVLVMPSIALSSPSLAPSAAPPCSIATVEVSLKFGVLERKSYQERT